MDGEKIIQGTRPDTSRQGAKELLQEISVLALEFPDRPVVVAWCGGTSPDKLCAAFTSEFAQLAATIQRRVHFVLVDERRVPLDDPQSNYQALERGMFAELQAAELISPEQVHPFPVGLDPLEAVATYTETITRLGGIQIVILGVGPDAHVAALFPGHPALGQKESAYLYIADRPKPPREGFTASVSLLQQASVCFLLFFGEEKRSALEKYHRQSSLNDAPVSLARAIPTRYLLTDIA